MDEGWIHTYVWVPNENLSGECQSDAYTAAAAATTTICYSYHYWLLVLVHRLLLQFPVFV